MTGIHTILAVALVLLLSGCATGVYPITSGSQAKALRAKASQESRPLNMIVWGEHAGAVSQAIDITLQRGHRVIERAQLQTVLNEQKLRLTHTRDDEADLLRVGQLVGADAILFVETAVARETVTPMATLDQDSRGAYMLGAALAGRDASAQYSIYHMRVSVRLVYVETGEIGLSGSAWYPKPIRDPEQGVIYLTRASIARAMCRDKWSDEEGCHTP